MSETLDRARAWTERHPQATDAAIAAAFIVFGWLSIAGSLRANDPGPSIAAVLSVVVIAAPLAWRRRAPVATLAIITVAITPYAFVGLPATFWYGNAWVLAAYTAGVYGRGRWRDPVRVASSVLLIATLIYGLIVAPAPDVAEPSALDAFVLVAGNAAFVVWIWPFGNETRIRREREAELAERTRQLEREREDNAYRAVLAERVRIARELHDVVAHHVSVMGVQASAARRVLPTRPERADQALAAIEVTSREAVGDMHRLLGFLRRDADEASLAPQPGLRDLDALLAQMREAGLPVTLAVEGDERPVPPAVDLSAYRITQEALTNALRHAAPTTASVTLRYGARALEVEVNDTGSTGAGPRARSGSGGNGIIGMRERTALLGGQLWTGPGPARGFTVRATLPFDGSPT